MVEPDQDLKARELMEYYNPEALVETLTVG
jgi:hypothetical protein